MKLITAAVIVLLAVVLLWLGRSQAADLSVTWTNPTQNTDSTAIPASGAGSLTQTRVEYGTCLGAAFGTKAGEVVAAAPATSASIPGLAPGTWCARAFAKNTYGSESAASNVASKVINAPTPQPPVIVTIAQTAYAIKNTRHGEQLVAVGTIALGVQCIGLAPRLEPDLFNVPKSSVKFYKPLRGRELVGQCG